MRGLEVTSASELETPTDDYHRQFARTPIVQHTTGGIYCFARGVHRDLIQKDGSTDERQKHCLSS
jgi:hypothetical protein